MSEVYYYCSESNKMFSRKALEKSRLREIECGNWLFTDNLNRYIEACMWYNNGTLTPVYDLSEYAINCFGDIFEKESWEDVNEYDIYLYPIGYWERTLTEKDVIDD